MERIIAIHIGFMGTDGNSITDSFSNAVDKQSRDIVVVSSRDVRPFLQLLVLFFEQFRDLVKKLIGSCLSFMATTPDVSAS